MNNCKWTVEQARLDFPLLQFNMRGKPLAYLDNAATTQKPKVVLQAIQEYYAHDNANVHRSVHQLSERATLAFEQARLCAQNFLNAHESSEIIFVRGTTEAINLIAQSFARPRLQGGDEILLSHMEHHSNIVPWQLIAEQTGAKIKVIPVTDQGELDLNAFDILLTEKVKIFAIAHISNALGTINPLKELIAKAHHFNIPVVVDGAQAAPHTEIDVQDLDCDFYAISGHKMYGPTGIGVLYGKHQHLEAMPPYHGGGEMIATVSFEGSTYNKLPYKFEAGTPNIAGAIGLNAAMTYLQQKQLKNIAACEHALLEHATKMLMTVPGLTIIGQAKNKAAVISFTIDSIHPHDIGTILDHYGVAIRAGHHCAMPLMQRFGVSATARASFSFYNTRQDVEQLVMGLQEVHQLFS